MTKINMKGLTKDDIKNLTRPERYATVTAAARQAILNAFDSGKYDVDDIIVEPKSYFDDDWYLWTVCAMELPIDANDPRNATYTIWTLNLTTLSLNNGDYKVPKCDITNAITKRRHV